MSSSESRPAADSGRDTESGEGSPAEGGRRPWWKSWRTIVSVVGGAVILFWGYSVMVAEQGHKHVISEPEMKTDKETGEILVTDPEMTVTVRKGDTLYSIANRSQVTVQELKAANNLKGDRILPGASLFIPGVMTPDEVSGELEEVA